jgi:hypothetical protein
MPRTTVRRDQCVIVARADGLLSGLEVVRRENARFAIMLSTRLAATSSPLPVRSRRTSEAQMPIAA